MSNQEDKQYNELVEKYGQIVDALLSCNRKQTVEHFLENLEFED